MINNIHFTAQECNSIIELVKNLNRLKSDLYFPNVPSIKYDVWNLSIDKENKWISDRINQYFTETTKIKIKEDIKTIHIHRYGKGDRFHKHTDEYYPTQLHNVGVCLNENYVGGEFILYEPELILPKKVGTIYTFRSSRPHEVLEIVDGERWSIISFFHVHNLDLKKNLV